MLSVSISHLYIQKKNSYLSFSAEEDVTSGRMEFPELFNGTFSYSRYSGKRWSKVNPEEYFSSDSEMIKKVKFDLEVIKAGKTEEDFTFSTFLNANWRDLCGEKTCTDYQISADEKYIFTQEKL